jgi:integrase
MDAKIIAFPLIGERRTEYRYGLYFHKLAAPDGTVYTRPLIVLRNGYGDIVRFTGLHRFAEPFAGKVYAPLISDGRERLYHVCSMLNYILIEQYARFETDHVFLVTWEAINTFFQSYAYEQSANGKFRSRSTIEKCVNNVTDFFRRLKVQFGNAVLLRPEELYTETTVYGKGGRQIIRRAPAFQAKGIPCHNEIFRELPTKAFGILLNLAFRYAPDIAFAICLQAFAGLRAGEVCNVRQDHSPAGSGITVTRIGDDVRKIEIDLTRELPMRSDGVVCGKIKKERVQCVYPPFIKAFGVAYAHHTAWIATRGFESDYCPMFVNSKGLAMTYDAYQSRFYALTDKHFRKELLRGGDPKLRIYGQLLYENRLGLHALRHWYSIQLVLHGEDIAQIQYWRGDKNPESAFAYLQNKGDLVRELESCGEFLIEALMDEGARRINE